MSGSGATANAIAGAVAFLVLIYLCYALLRPEKF